MALPTHVIAVTPNYETIDVSAPNYVETCVAELAKETSIVSVIQDPYELKEKQLLYILYIRHNHVPRHNRQRGCLYIRGSQPFFTRGPLNPNFNIRGPPYTSKI